MSNLITTFKKLISSLFRAGFGFILIVVLAFVLGWQLGHRDYSLQIKNYKPEFIVKNQVPENQKEEIDFKLFWDAWNLVSQQYIDKKAIDPKKLYYGAIQGMVAAIGDPYTVFLPPTAQKSSKEQLGGAFEGVGMQLGFNKDKRLVVIAPLKDTPAEKAGVKSGDMILEIDKKDTSALTLPEAVNLIRGPKGTSINLSLFGENDTKPREVFLTRETITIKSVEFSAKKTLSGKPIGYIRITTFGDKTNAEWDKAVREALSNSLQGLIIDVRNNPGGYLEDSIYIASEFIAKQEAEGFIAKQEAEGFINKGTVVMQEDVSGERKEFPIVRIGKILKLPVVVLINKGSASASEILAGAIQDYKRGTLLGEQSFGKGTIQSAEDLAQNTGIHITTAKWLTPNGRWIHNIGLTPDVKVESGSDPVKDLQLDQALEILDQK